VAMSTGQVSDIVALDLDSQDAITEALRRGLPDDTSVVKTRRGWHWHFNAPDEPLQSRDLFPGAELKAENVYVVAPPSMHQLVVATGSYRLPTASRLIHRSGYQKRWLSASTKMHATPQP
jgi:Bifunctional DNA primase/polymerase, N-terminal